jgi:hypothetical protein
MPLSKTTRDHDTIRNWAERRGAIPAEVAGTEKGKQTGILRFAFPKAKGHNDDKLQEVSWDEFFKKFDKNGLELIYQEKTAAGAESNFNKLIYPENEHASRKSSSSSGRTQAASSNTRASTSHSSSGASAKRSSPSGKSTSSRSASGGSSRRTSSPERKRAA